MRRKSFKFLSGLLTMIAAIFMLGFCGMKVNAATYTHIDYSSQIRNYRICQQREADCAIVSIASIEAFHKGTKDGVYEEVYGKNGKKVYISSWSNMGYEKWGYSLENLYRALQRGPCIIQRTGHFSVVVAYEGSTSSLEKSGFKVMEIVGYYKYDGGYGHPTSWLNDYDDAVKVPLNVWGSKGGASLEGIAVRKEGLGQGSNGSHLDVNIDSEFPLRDGEIYRIKNVNSGKYIDIKSKSLEKKAILHQWTGHSAASQQWKAVKHSDGYSFISEHSGLAMDIADASTSSGADLWQYKYNESSAQRFKLVSRGNGTYSIHPVCSNLTLDIYASSTEDGGLIEQRVFHGKNNQLFVFEAVRPIQVEGYTLSSTNLNLKVNETKQLTVTSYTPADANTALSTIWASTDNSIITVDTQGNVTGVKEGTANIICTFGGIVQVCSVTVEGTVTSAIFSKIYVSDLSDTNATMEANLNGTYYVTTGGVYFGTEPANLSKVTVTENGNAKKVYYNANKYIGTLHPGTNYYYQVYAVIDGVEHKSDMMQFTTADTTAPTVSSAEIIDADATGYTIRCRASDNGWISRVCFPTWTASNGQDDLIGDWYNQAAVVSPDAHGYYNYRVNISDHNYESGIYTTHIYAYDSVGNHSEVIDVSSSIYPLQEISLSSTNKSVEVGEQFELSVIYTPENTTENKDVVWSSSDSSVAKVDNGKVSALKPGTATITATVAGKQAECTVTVALAATPTPEPTKAPVATPTPKPTAKPETTPEPTEKPTATPTSTPTPTPAPVPVQNGWLKESSTSYWYENGLRQGTYEDSKGVLGDGTIRGREIYDPISDGWYWLDAVYNGAKAINKEVWMPYIYQNEADWDEAEIAANAANSGDMAEQVIREIKNRSGKWVRYDANGKMYKGWYTVEGADAKIYPNQVGNTYYYDPKTGLMAKGKVNIGGETYYFDEVTGVLKK